MENKKIKIEKDGPYVVSGNIPLDKQYIEVDNDNNPIRWKRGESYPLKECYSLCRCGKSDNKPYCDGNHNKGFNGTETASKGKYLDQSNKIAGPDLDLYDNHKICAAARFCHRASGTWNLIEHSDDPESKKIAIEESCNCPSGRLTACKKDGKMIEPELDKNLSLVEDPSANVSGPIYAKGGIEIESSDGEKYETRNRVTLCRCGHSKNKPFCDGSHIDSGFNDGDEKLTTR